MLNPFPLCLMCAITLTGCISNKPMSSSESKVVVTYEAQLFNERVGGLRTVSLANIYECGRWELIEVDEAGNHQIIADGTVETVFFDIVTNDKRNRLIENRNGRLSRFTYGLDDSKQALPASLLLLRKYVRDAGVPPDAGL
ncbi:MAG: hypothetical protein KatS3mg104_1532 [Phycisphaerae bacterium]|nr:MAG: hypothetical protein KatS3mg104_1532 [Phycisphaerae bacterium]